MHRPFSLANHTVLITGGSKGIGLALAQRFVRAGSKVVICGRDVTVMRNIEKESNGKITAVACDVANKEDRNALALRVKNEFPNVDVLINNAGIQVRSKPWQEQLDWTALSNEVEINVVAPMHLSNLLLPHLLSKPSAAIMNVSSGLAFAPISTMPMYCATKAAIHSFTMSLRHQLKNTNVRVFEIIPPAVQTDLGGKGLHTFGVPLQEWTDHAETCIAQGMEEFGYQFSAAGLAASAPLKQVFEKLNVKL